MGERERKRWNNRNIFDKVRLRLKVARIDTKCWIRQRVRQQFWRKGNRLCFEFEHFFRESEEVRRSEESGCWKPIAHYASFSLRCVANSETVGHASLYK